MKGWGALYIVVAFFAGYSALLTMMSWVNGSPESLWPVLAFAAAILLFGEGLKRCFQQIANRWLVIVVATVPLAICSLFGEWPLHVWIFSVVLAITEVILLRVSKRLKRDGIISFVSCVILALALADSTYRLFSMYWIGWWSWKSQWGITDIASFMLPTLIPWTILTCILVHTGIDVFGHRTQSETLPPSDANSI